MARNQSEEDHGGRVSKWQ